MANLQELLTQQAELERKITELQREQRANAIAEVRSIMTEFGITAADLGSRATGPRSATVPKPPSKVAVKYRNAATGETWTGRGLQPKWLRAALANGAKIDDFTV